MWRSGVGDVGWNDDNVDFEVVERRRRGSNLTC